MEKFAADRIPTAEDLRKIAAFSYATALAAPAAGCAPAVVKAATAAFKRGMEKAAARHEKIVEIVRAHVQGTASRA